MTKYERLRKAATKATCGRWSLDYGDDFFYDGDALICREIVGYLPICRVEGAHPKSGFEEGFIKEQQHNAEFIAAANPTTVLELLDELEAAEKRIAELESRKVGLPVASCTVEDGEMCIDGFSEYIGHSLPDGMHELYAAPIPVEINDDMAYAFHHALSDSSLGADEVEEIKTGLRAAFANVTAQPVPVVPDEIEPDDSNTFDYVDGWNACRAAMLERKGE